jgi:hypothetical protein
LKFYSILYKDKKVNIVTILPHKESGKYSYINMTKGHICPCQFESIEAALKDLESYDNIEIWEEIQW